MYHYLIFQDVEIAFDCGTVATIQGVAFNGIYLLQNSNCKLERMNQVITIGKKVANKQYVATQLLINIVKVPLNCLVTREYYIAVASKTLLIVTL